MANGLLRYGDGQLGSTSDAANVKHLGFASVTKPLNMHGLKLYWSCKTLMIDAGHVLPIPREKDTLGRDYSCRHYRWSSSHTLQRTGREPR